MDPWNIRGCIGALACTDHVQPLHCGPLRLNDRLYHTGTQHIRRLGPFPLSDDDHPTRGWWYFA